MVYTEVMTTNNEQTIQDEVALKEIADLEATYLNADREVAAAKKQVARMVKIRSQVGVEIARRRFLSEADVQMGDQVNLIRDGKKRLAQVIEFRVDGGTRWAMMVVQLVRKDGELSQSASAKTTVGLWNRDDPDSWCGWETI